MVIYSWIVNSMRWCDQSLITRCVPQLRASCPHSRQGNRKRRHQELWCLVLGKQVFPDLSQQTSTCFTGLKQSRGPPWKQGRLGKQMAAFLVPLVEQGRKKILTSQTRVCRHYLCWIPPVLPLEREHELHLVWADHARQQLLMSPFLF